VFSVLLTLRSFVGNFVGNFVENFVENFVGTSSTRFKFEKRPSNLARFFDEVLDEVPDEGTKRSATQIHSGGPSAFQRTEALRHRMRNLVGALNK